MFIKNLGHKTKMATMPIYGKKKTAKLLLQNCFTDFIGTWHVASGLEYYNVFINHDL